MSNRKQDELRYLKDVALQKACYTTSVSSCKRFHLKHSRHILVENLTKRYP